MGRKAKSSESMLKPADLFAAWRTGWSPADVNAVLDRLEKIGDPNDPPADDEDDDIDPIVPPADDEDDDIDPIVPPADDKDDNDPNNPPADDKDDANATLDAMKQVALEVENQRLKAEIQKLQNLNKHKDVSSDNNQKSCEAALIDALQSCFD